MNLISTWGISSTIILNEAKKENLETNVLSIENNVFSIIKNNKKVYFKSVDCGLNSAFGFKIVENKELTYLLAEENNIRVPKSIYINKSELYKTNFENLDISFPVVTKPVDGAHGDGVAINLKNIEELKKGLEYSFNEEKTTRVIIQEQIFGEDHRIIVINGKIVAVTKRIAPFIIGNGKNTIQELIDIENNNPLRGGGEDHDAAMSKIKIDSESIDYIKEQGYSMGSILEIDKQIKVRKNENLSTGGLAIDMTDKIHPEIKQEAIKIAKLTGLGFAGVDFFCEDISLPLKEGKGAIIEVNATPGIRMHHFPSIGKPRNVAKKILEAIF